jgi:hypothetical protein
LIVTAAFAPVFTVDGLIEIEVIVGNGAGLTVTVTLALPVPAMLLALMLTPKVPAVVGVPEIKPVVVLTERPPGSPLAP